MRTDLKKVKQFAESVKTRNKTKTFSFRFNAETAEKMITASRESGLTYTEYLESLIHLNDDNLQSTLPRYKVVEISKALKIHVATILEYFFSGTIQIEAYCKGKNEILPLYLDSVKANFFERTPIEAKFAVDESLHEELLANKNKSIKFQRSKEEESTFIITDLAQEEIQISDLYVNSYFFDKLKRLIAEKRKPKKCLFSPDFSTVSFRNADVRLNGKQAAILRFLYELPEGESVSWKDFYIAYNGKEKFKHSESFGRYFRSGNFKDLLKEITKQKGQKYQFNRDF